jgi:thiamine pyrophosphokinase
VESLSCLFPACARWDKEMQKTDVKTALVIVNGVLPATRILDELRARSHTTICADGGANRAFAAGIIPDYIVGDLDSMTDETRRAFSSAQIVHRPSQYETDLEKTLNFAVELGVTRALLVGVTGFRLDHQLVNLNIAEKFCDRLEIETHDDHGVGQFIHEKEIIFEAPIGEQISLISFRRAEGIDTDGLKYPLHDEALEWAVRDGLSNEVVASPVRISVKRGTLFCYRVRSVTSVQ